jgi:hypothetical protein
MPIQVASFLIPRNNNTWYILEDKYLKGGLRVCTDVAERTAIHAASLKLGMLVLLLSDNKIYQLKNVSTKLWEPYVSSTPQVNPFHTHKQVAPSDVWTIQHNKANRYFQHTLFDDSGKSILPDEITIIDNNTVQIKFIMPIMGHCVLAFDSAAV